MMLDELRPYTGKCEYVFSYKLEKRPISDMCLRMALRRIDAKTTVHGFRASFRTICDEVLGIAPYILEHQLAHKVRDQLGRAYNRTTHLAERVELLRLWGSFVEGEHLD